VTAQGRILALGGHEFDRRDGNDAICDLITELADSQHPRICLLPTASGDPEDQIVRFRGAFGERGCLPTVVSLFRLGARPVDLHAELLQQDVIYVGGGSLVNLVAVWRAHGLDRILRECWREGILLCGQSAGAMCWFEGGVTSSSGEPEAAAGLGLLPGSASVHHRSDAARRRRFLEAVATGDLPDGIGLEDQTGAVFEGRTLVETVAAREGAAVWEVKAIDGEWHESRLVPRLLDVTRPPINEMRSEILELRQTLAARAASRGARRTGPGRLD
jgi:peptidase E